MLPPKKAMLDHPTGLSSPISNDDLHLIKSVNEKWLRTLFTTNQMVLK